MKEENKKFKLIVTSNKLKDLHKITALILESKHFKNMTLKEFQEVKK